MQEIIDKGLLPNIMNLLKVIEKESLINNGEKVIVSVSGGADSVALLHLLYLIKDFLNLTLVSVHFNHHLREKESELDADFVKSFSESLGVTSFIIDLDVKSYSIENKKGIEESARELRYFYLEKIRSEEGADKIATAHTKDDKIETVFMNIMRGSGIGGLVGLGHKTGHIIRPFVSFSKSEILEYLAENNIDYRTDTTNFQNDYTRNKVRNLLIPFIKENFDYNVESSVLNLSEIASETLDFINKYVQDFMEDNYCHGKISTAKLLEESSAVRHNIIREMIKNAKGNYVDITFSEIRRIDDFLIQRKPFKTALDGGELYAVSDDNFFFIHKEEKNLEEKVFSYYLNLDGETFIPELGITVLSSKAVEVSFSLDKFYFLRKNALKMCVKSVDKVSKSMYFSPLGMNGQKKKISDILKDKKILFSKRNSLFILFDEENRPLWIPGIISSEHGRINKNNTDNLYVLTIK